MTPVADYVKLMDRIYNGIDRGIRPDGDFHPRSDGTTACNLFVQFVCGGMGYDGLNGLLANQMVGFMQAPENGWITVGEDVAQSHANKGVIVIAGWANPKGHGHVCLIVPGLLENSNSFGKAVPKCASVGKDVFLGKRISFAFEAPNELPNYFALAGMI